MPDSFAELMKRRKEERISALQALLARSENERRRWEVSPERHGGEEAAKIRNRYIRGWVFELKELQG